MSFLAREWASYRERVTPADAGEVQIQESRRAFYAGARALWKAMVAVGEPEISEDDGVSVFEAIDAELKAFVADVEAGRA